MTSFDRTPAKTAKARSLRIGQTDCERIVWSRLRSAQVEGASFRRQHPIGPYVLDLYCPQLRLAVEIDGGQHGGPSDVRRDTALRGRGIVTLRFWNSDVTENLDGVMEVIRSNILDRRLGEVTPPSLPLSGGGEKTRPLLKRPPTPKLLPLKGGGREGVNADRRKVRAETLPHETRPSH